MTAGSAPFASVQSESRANDSWLSCRLVHMWESQFKVRQPTLRLGIFLSHSLVYQKPKSLPLAVFLSIQMLPLHVWQLFDTYVIPACLSTLNTQQNRTC